MLGLDPAGAPVVEGLSPALAEMLDELATPTGVGPLVARAVERGADAGAADALLRELVHAGAVVDAALADRAERHRAGSAVVVSGRGPLAVGIVTGLVHAGVGAVHTDTGGTVRSVDLGTGLVDADRGSERLAATRAAVRRLVPTAATDRPPRGAPDLVVLADTVPEPVRLADLFATGTAHLAVRLRDGIGVIGPLVLPGRSTCLRCLEVHRGARDPAWPAVAAALAGRSGRADPACTAATAALATAQALAALDGTARGGAEPAALDATLELDVRAGTLLRREWEPSPSCGCGADTAHGGARHRPVTSAEHRRGDTIKV